ncbi:MAG: 4Fe-4S binding protein [Anaerolineales bacterium]|nr:4Fe-4S binding protein [Anaerolineales bacterium]
MSLSPSTNGFPHIDESTCLLCDDCQARYVCRTKAIRSIDPGEPPFIDVHRCMGCYECVTACPGNAIVRPIAVI